jgi:putative hydrolase of the HAD superfamily
MAAILPVNTSSDNDAMANSSQQTQESAQIDWADIDTVLLDMDGTLLDLHFDNHFWLEYVPLKYAEQHGLTLEQSNTELVERFATLQGKLEWYCLDFWTKELNLDIVGLKREIEHLIAIRPGVESFLQQLSKSKKRAVLVTNAHQGSLSLKLANTNLDRYLDMVICSHDFGKPKEDRSFWHSLQEVEQFDPQRTLFVDDSESVLDSAHDYGIQHLRAIVKPDSKKPENFDRRYPAILEFSDLLPIY